MLCLRLRITTRNGFNCPTGEREESFFHSSGAPPGFCLTHSCPVIPAAMYFKKTERRSTLDLSRIIMDGFSVYSYSERGCVCWTMLCVFISMLVRYYIHVNFMTTSIGRVLDRAFLETCAMDYPHVVVNFAFSIVQ